MTDEYHVEVKRSARLERTVPDDAYDEDDRFSVASEREAEEWVADHNQSTPSHGKLFLRDADPDDNSDVDAYLVFRQPNLCDDIDDRKTSILVAGHEPYSGTLFINEATQELFTFAYAVDDFAICIAHGHTTCDPKGVITIDLDTFDKYRGSGRYRALDVV